MILHDGTLTFSPTDLSLWIESPYATWMRRLEAERRGEAPERDPEDPLLSRLARHGHAHEDRLEKRFRDEGRSVVNVAEVVPERAGESFRDREAAMIDRTLEELANGTEVICQATLSHDGFRGHADFLVRVDGESDLGAWHYEVWDTKLARRAKPGAVLQLCCYADLLRAVQGRLADDVVVALGDDGFERVRLDHCFDWYAAVRAAFLDAQAEWRADAPPDPADHGNHGEWAGHAAELLERSDDLRRVAGISHRQIERLRAAGIDTMTALAAAEGPAVAGIEGATLGRLVHQATLQLETLRARRDDPDAPPAFAPIDSPEGTGFHALPDASPLDVYFDLEGCPIEADGLEYLWGCTYRGEDGAPVFRDWWAHDADAERVAFEAFVDWVHARRQEDPSMHVYHYAAYEVSACKRLASRHGTREAELDALLRAGVFVDLYAVVRHAVRIGEPSYSIKKVERLYRGARSAEGGAVGAGDDSVVVYDLWREARARGEDGDDWRESEALGRIRDYNRDDCDSTLELADWLRALRPEAVAAEGAAPSDDASDRDAAPEIPEEVRERLALRDRLLERAAASGLSDDERDLLETLAGVLEFHRREDRSMWWRYFERMDESNDSLADDADCVADCRRTDREPFPVPGGRNLAYEYAFDPGQRLKDLPGAVWLKGAWTDDGRARTATVARDLSDPVAGLVVVRCGVEPPEAVSLVPREGVRAHPIPTAIDAVVAELEHGLDARSAIADFLSRRPPAIEGRSGGPVVTGDTAEARLEATIDAVRRLDRSCLVIQGPPGCGKSYTGARVIAALVAAGRRVGIASNSHAAINHLLIGTARHCAEAGIEGTFLCTKRTDEGLDELGVEVVQNGQLANRLVDGCVVGTTAWGFSRDELAGAFDVLVVDEAGQVSVANLVGMSRAAENLVLMGDQRQLGQPVQGSHPASSGLSALDYRLGDAAVVDPEHGVFLGTTYRMHPAVNATVSRVVYDRSLGADDRTRDRTLAAVCDGPADPLDVPAGIVHLPVFHEGRTQDSEEEVRAVVEAVRALTGRPLRRADGTVRPVALDDMLFVAPYNAQVSRLQAALGEGARVGTVDRFQGREAPIVFLSLCTSDAAASPRGTGFVLDRNRLNVGVSRAETLCVVVAHPGLATTVPRSLDDVRRVSFVAALMGDGTAQRVVSPVRAPSRVGPPAPRF